MDFDAHDPSPRAIPRGYVEISIEPSPADEDGALVAAFTGILEAPTALAMDRRVYEFHQGQPVALAAPTRVWLAAHTSISV
jgi:hypothetical protein